jgi:formylglycine-generating enzyme required for sulfatase activity
MDKGRMNQAPVTTMQKLRMAKVKPPEMVQIPAGEFVMGISDDQIQDLVMKEDWATEWFDRDLFLIEQPQHLVYLPAYEIGRCPITNAEYHQFVWNTGYQVPKDWIGFHFPESTGNHPVVGISKKDALAYCDWLNQQLGREQAVRQFIGKNQGGGIGQNIQYRLPSEAEWERAARGRDDRLYPWGEEFDPWRCNTIESGKRSTTAVGEYSPSGDSPWGIADMAGNIFEWTGSYITPYPYDESEASQNPDGKRLCVVRGGSWYYSHKLARCTSRESVLPTFTSLSLGFRLARSL